MVMETIAVTGLIIIGMMLAINAMREWSRQSKEEKETNAPD